MRKCGLGWREPPAAVIHQGAIYAQPSTNQPVPLASLPAQETYYYAKTLLEAATAYPGKWAACVSHKCGWAACRRMCPGPGS